MKKSVKRFFSNWTQSKHETWLNCWVRLYLNAQSPHSTHTHKNAFVNSSEQMSKRADSVFRIYNNYKGIKQTFSNGK